MDLFVVIEQELTQPTHDVEATSKISWYIVATSNNVIMTLKQRWLSDVGFET